MPQLTMTLTAGGAAFIVWYGIKAFQRLMRSEAIAVSPQDAVPLGRVHGATAAFTLLNPHVYLDTVLLMGVAGSARALELRPVFVAGAASASIIWFAALGYGARVLKPRFARPAAWKVLDALVGTIMLTMAAALVGRLVS